MKALLKVIGCSMVITLIASSSALAGDEIRFGVPPWPGVTVKTEIVCQLLETMGYETEQTEVGPPVIYKGMEDDEIDAFLGAWTPQQNPLLNPLREQGRVEIVRTNLKDAVISLCVPKYAAKAGLKSFSDLDDHADKFDSHIYNIDVGSPMHTAMEEIIEKDVAGLGDWEQTGTATPIMLQQVKSMMDQGKWVAFACWKPHWMNVGLEMAYLEAAPGTEKFANDSLIHTVVRSDFKQRFPGVYKMFENIRITALTQSRWINAFSKEGQRVEVVAKEWISNNPEQVSQWLEGVTAPDGSPGAEKILSQL
ncbi:MAG: ABC transporter substrate-binding protein [Desulfobacteraceae bacterium]